MQTSLRLQVNKGMKSWTKLKYTYAPFKKLKKMKQGRQMGLVGSFIHSFSAPISTSERVKQIKKLIPGTK